jgi:hypothetical protein
MDTTERDRDRGGRARDWAMLSLILALSAPFVLVTAARFSIEDQTPARLLIPASLVSIGAVAAGWIGLRGKQSATGWIGVILGAIEMALLLLIWGMWGPLNEPL